MNPYTLHPPAPAPSVWRRLTRWFRQEQADETLRERLEHIIEQPTSLPELGLQHEKILLTNILKLSSLTVHGLMVPRADIVAVELGTPFSQVVHAFKESSHSRLPVYRDSLDEVVGVIHIRDIFHYIDQPPPASIRPLLRTPLFVSPSMRALDLLLKMRATHVHLALVVDEFGGIDGLLTIEDLIEEIVGEIEDEHDVDDDPRLDETAPGQFLADARVRLDHFSKVANVVLTPQNGVDTLGGLVFSLAGRVPSRGEIITDDNGLQFEVVDADTRRIKRLRIKRIVLLPAAADPAP